MITLNKQHRRYEQYCDSGVEWLGEIPEGWETSKLKRLGRIDTGNTPPKSDESNYSEDGTPWIKPDELREFEPLTNSKDKLSSTGAEYARIISKDSVLICGIGSIGKMGIAGCSLATNQQINSVTFNRKVSNKFGAYLAHAAKEVMEANSNKVVVSILNKTDLGNIGVPFPSVLEQQSIASYLDEKCALIDSIITAKKRQLELLKEKRAAVIHQAVTKGLNENVKMKDSGVEWIGEIPEGWKLERMKYNASNIRHPVDAENTQNLLALENVESWTGKLIPSTEELSLETANGFQKDNVLFGKLRPYLAKVHHAEFEGGCVGEFLVLDSSENIEPRYLFYRLLAHDFISVISNSTMGAKMPRAEWNFIGNLPLTVPSKPEQQSIASYLNEKCAEFDLLKKKIDTSISLLSEYKTSLISHVVTGKVKITPEKYD